MHIHKPLLIIRSLFPASLSGLCPFLGDDDNETLNNILACQWNFEEQEFVDTSEEAKDFISRLLIVNKRYLDFVHIHWPLILRKLIIHEVCKNKYCDFVFPISWRMGACEALRHPWLADPALHHRLHTKVKHAFVRVKAFYAGKVLKFVKYVNLVKKIIWMHCALHLLWIFIPVLPLYWWLLFFVCFTENYVQITEIIMCAQYWKLRWVWKYCSIFKSVPFLYAHTSLYSPWAGCQCIRANTEKHTLTCTPNLESWVNWTDVFFLGCGTTS